MTWQEHHRMSEVYASHAEIAARRGDNQRARELYAAAAQAEESALAEIGDDKPRAYGITAVSAVALRYKAAQLREAQILAYRSLGSGRLPKFAHRQLENITDSIRVARAKLIEGDAQMLMSVKGGEILPGAAPLDLILKHTKNIKSLICRTAEFMHHLPYRKSGRPRKMIADSYRPWIVQAEPGSFQYSVAVTTKLSDGPRAIYTIPEPAAPRLVSMDLPSGGLTMGSTSPTALVHYLSGIMTVMVQSPIGGLPDIVPDPDYRRTFLRLICDLAPDGIQFSQLEIRAANQSEPIVLTPDTRWAIAEAIDACQNHDERNPASS